MIDFCEITGAHVQDYQVLVFPKILFGYSHRLVLFYFLNLGAFSLFGSVQDSVDYKNQQGS